MMSVMFCGFGLFAHADPDPTTVDKIVRPDHLDAVGIGVSELARSTLTGFAHCTTFLGSEIETRLQYRHLARSPPVKLSAIKSGANAIPDN
jgi:hypothetical protein